VELGKYLTSKVRGNRAETAAASKILINLEKCARASKDNQTTLNVGVNNLNYFRSCMWLGQARLTKFPPPTQDRVFTEIPIEGIIKLAGYGPDGIKSLNMLPVPGETWAEYLQRLAAASNVKKIKELHEWLERYLGGLPKLLSREVPRAEGVSKAIPFVFTSVTAIQFTHTFLVGHWGALGCQPMPISTPGEYDGPWLRLWCLSL
jgi:hypothetical protein